MEGKGVRAVIMGLLILGLVVGQTEAKSCCRNTTGRNCYNACRVPGTPRPVCANLCDCIHVTGTCPSTHPRSNMLENSDGDDVIEQVTTDLEASQSGPTAICLTPEKKACFNRCRAAPIICSRNCGCIYVPDLN